MRLVAITDLHGNVKMSRKLAGLIAGERPDILLIAGDITHFSGAETARKVLQPLIETGVPILSVHGNCDGRDVPELLDELGIWIHDRRRELNGVGFVGVGGSNITPFNTIWELSEGEIREILLRNYHPGDVILSHVPPKDTKADRVHSGLHVGSSALREFIEEKQPPLVITGHIHEARSVDRVGETVIVNPGPLFRGYYTVVEFEEGEKRVKNVELEKL
ncbi:metallophosphoesterase [Thermococcus henrietii]|uniref:metallophosphoesterase n=1 Tax=Thermococcus henrietii TaxID=2016361 RepID=UPI000C07306F|nr:metallophosphoesterase [Thermococcus henrietii]